MCAFVGLFWYMQTTKVSRFIYKIQMVTFMQHCIQNIVMFPNVSSVLFGHNTPLELFTCVQITLSSSSKVFKYQV